MRGLPRRAASKLLGDLNRRKNERIVTVDRIRAIETRTKHATVIRSKASPDSSRAGFFLFGACDLPAMLSLAPLISENPSGTTAIVSRGHVSTTRADFELQTLDDLPTDLCNEIIRRLKLKAGHFDPVLFETNFDVTKLDPKPFPKSVVFVSLGSNVVRTMYRHNETGLLVDPGGWWLGTGPAKVTDQETLEWFRSDFHSIGRLTPEQWQPLFAQVIERIQARMPAEIVVLNTLTIEPGSRTHNYGLRRHPEGLRRRGFHLALADLARQLGVAVIDIDRVLKRDGVQQQIDFAHFPVDRHEAIAYEGFQILQRKGVLNPIAGVNDRQ